MPELPSDQDISRDIKNVISAFARRAPVALKETDELIGTLRLRDMDLPFLAMALRAYVKRFRQSSTVSTVEVRKSETVADVVTLVQTKLHSVVVRRRTIMPPAPAVAGPRRPPTPPERPPRDSRTPSPSERDEE